VTAIPIVNGDWTLAIPLHIGAVFVAVSEAGQPFGQRWRTMLWTTAALMVAAFVGHAVSDWAIVAIALTAPIAFACGAIGSKSARAALGGMFTLVTFTIYIGMPVPVQDAGATVLLIGLGGFAQTVAAVAMGIARGQHRGTWTIQRWASGWDRAFVVHGVRLAIVMVIATAISEAAALPHPYWLPMTVAFMCKPDRDGTVDRVIHRLAGTCVGIVIMWAFDVAVSPSFGVFLFVSLLGATIFVAFIRVNYAVAVTGVTLDHRRTWRRGGPSRQHDGPPAFRHGDGSRSRAGGLLRSIICVELTGWPSQSLAPIGAATRYFIHQPGDVVHRWL
jgi:uncharacterized membrane protein YccC